MGKLIQNALEQHRATRGPITLRGYDSQRRVGKLGPGYGPAGLLGLYDFIPGPNPRAVIDRSGNGNDGFIGDSLTVPNINKDAYQQKLGGLVCERVLGNYATLPGAIVGGEGASTVFMCASPPLYADFPYFLGSQPQDRGSLILLNTNTGFLRVGIGISGGGTIVQNDTTPIDINKTTVLALRFTPGAHMDFWRDLTKIIHVPTAVTQKSVPTNVLIGWGGYGGTTFLSGTAYHAAFYGAALTDAEVEAYISTLMTAFST
jgi:hypothetical protein